MHNVFAFVHLWLVCYCVRNKRTNFFYPAETSLEFIENNSIIIFFSSICSLSQWCLSFYKSLQLKNGFLSQGMSRHKMLPMLLQNMEEIKMRQVHICRSWLTNSNNNNLVFFTDSIAPTSRAATKTDMKMTHNVL